MYLRKLTLFIILGIFACMILLQYATSRFVLMGSLAGLEHRAMRENVQRVRHALDQKRLALDISALDWSARDDTYAFMRDGNQAYIASNLQDQTLMDMQIDFLVLIDRDGRPVFSRIIDRAARRTIPVSADFFRSVLPVGRLAGEKQRSGVLNFDRGPALIAAHPILTSRKTGPSRGTLVIGHFFDQRLVKELSDTTQLKLGFLGPTDLPPDLMADASSRAEAGVAVREIDANTMAGYALIPDITRKPALVVRVTQARDTYAQARHGLMVFMLIILTVGILCALAILLILERYLLSRLGFISQRVEEIGQRGDMSERITLPGQDEFSRLADSIDHMLGTLEDAGRALTEGEAKYRAVVEQANDGIIIIQDHFLRYVNPRVEQFTGYTAAELRDAPVELVLPPVEFVKMRELIDKTNRYEAIGEIYETVARRKDGTHFPIEFNVGIIPFREGHRAGLIIVRDISERKKAEALLASEKERLSVTLRSIGEGVITTDRDGRVVLMNHVAERLTGWTQDEACTHPLTEVFPIVKEQTHARCDAPLNRILSQGVVVELINQTILIARNGTERQIAVTGAPIRSQEAAVIGIVLVFRDMTEKNRIDAELLKMQRLDSISALAGGIAHDFNNILAAIIGNLSLARRLVTGEDMLATCLAQAEQASLRARDLTQQLLTFSKGGLPIKKTSSIAEIIRDSADFVLRGANVKCTYALPSELWLVDIDPGQISQVIHNLTLNAMQAMPEGGIMRIQARNITVGEGQPLPLPHGRYVQISVRDHGTGIPAEDIGRIFDPFFSTKVHGKGLGLATAYSIITKHAGLITARSDPGVETTFDIYLPAARDQNRNAPMEEALLSPGKGAILVMEDEEAVRTFLHTTLNLLGYTAVFALDGEDAIAQYREAMDRAQPFDAVIMDLTIPGAMGGKEAIGILRQIDPAIKAIVSSGYSHDPVMAHYREYGFQGVVAKPYTVADLSAALRNVLKA